MKGFTAYGIPTKLHKLLTAACNGDHSKTILHNGEIYYKFHDGARDCLIAGLGTGTVSGAQVREWLATDPGVEALQIAKDMAAIQAFDNRVKADYFAQYTFNLDLFTSRLRIIVYQWVIHGGSL